MASLKNIDAIICIAIFKLYVKLVFSFSIAILSLNDDQLMLVNGYYQ